MSGRYDASRLAVVAKLSPESRGLEDTRDEWWIEGISVPKSSRPTDPKALPSYRRGWTFRLESEMRFVSIPFARDDGTPAIGIVLRGATEDFFAGWFDAKRSNEVRLTVDQLNDELDAERRRHPVPEEVREEVVLDIGAEYAPDSPHGRERIRLTPDGVVRYEQANRGAVSTAVGHVEPATWTTVVAALSKTSFPAPPQAALPPGGGIVKLAVSGPRSGHVLVDYHDALEMEGYGDIVAKLVELCAAIRTNDRAKLSVLGYEGEVVES